MHDALHDHGITLSLLDIPEPTAIPLALTEQTVDAVILKSVLRGGLVWPTPLRAAAVQIFTESLPDNVLPPFQEP